MHSDAKKRRSYLALLFTAGDLKPYFFLNRLINFINEIQMQVKHSETAKIDPNCEIRLGIASWDDGSNTAKSVKYTWFDKNGKAARGGELPVEDLPQALDFAIRNGYVSL